MRFCVDFDNGKKTLMLLRSLRGLIHNVSFIGSLEVSELVWSMSPHISDELILSD